MRNQTHLVAGSLLTLGLGYLAQVPLGWPEVVAGAVAGLVPNVDHVFMALERSPYPTLRRLAGRVLGGGMTHAAIVALPAGVLLGFLALRGTGRPGMFVAGVAGVLSHLLLDIFSQVGVQLWVPFSRAWIAFPPWAHLRPPRGGTVDVALFTGGGVLLALLAIYALFPAAQRLAQLLLGGGR